MTDPWIGRTYEGCRLDVRIAASSSAHLYRATIVESEAPVCVALVHPGPQRRLPDPIKVLQLHWRLRRHPHPGLALIQHACMIDGQMLLIMRPLRGETLQHTFRRGPMAPSGVVQLAQELASVLAHLHALDIVHGQLAPTRILLTPNGACLLELGAADPSKTGTKALDIIAAGYCLYTAATGRAATTQPLSTADHAPMLPAWMATLIDDCRSADPGRRPADGAALLARVTNHLDPIRPRRSNAHATPAAESLPTQPPPVPPAPPTPAPVHARPEDDAPPASVRHPGSRLETIPPPSEQPVQPPSSPAQPPSEPPPPLPPESEFDDIPTLLSLAPPPPPAPAPSEPPAPSAPQLEDCPEDPADAGPQPASRRKVRTPKNRPHTAAPPPTVPPRSVPTAAPSPAPTPSVAAAPSSVTEAPAPAPTTPSPRTASAPQPRRGSHPAILGAAIGLVTILAVAMVFLGAWWMSRASRPETAALEPGAESTPAVRANDTASASAPASVQAAMLTITNQGGRPVHLSCSWTAPEGTGDTASTGIEEALLDNESATSDAVPIGVECHALEPSSGTALWSWTGATPPANGTAWVLEIPTLPAAPPRTPRTRRVPPSVEPDPMPLPPTPMPLPEVKEAPATGATLRVVSGAKRKRKREGVEVRVDGMKRGIAPVTLEAFPLGTHRIEASWEGQSVTCALTLKAGGMTVAVDPSSKLCRKQ